jgi:hypothetical protein
MTQKLTDYVRTAEDVRNDALEDAWKAKRAAAQLASMQRANTRALSRRVAVCVDAWAARSGGAA